MKKYASLSFLVAIAISLSACSNSQDTFKAPVAVPDKTTTVSDETYEGLTVEMAESMAAEKEVPFRVVMQDGEPLPATMDYRPGRINATVENGFVTSVAVEGMEEAETEIEATTEVEAEVEVMTYDSESWKTMIPESCSSYFDGCNNCNKAPGSEMGACTRKFCEEYQEPRCLDEEISETLEENDVETSLEEVTAE